MEISKAYLKQFQPKIKSDNKKNPNNCDNNCKTVTMDIKTPLETLGRSQVNFTSSRFQKSEYLDEREIADFKPPEKYESFFNLLKSKNYNPTMKIFTDYIGNDRFCFWASLCKYAPEKFEILYPFSEMTLKTKEPFLAGTLLFDGYRTILRMDTEELKDSISDLKEYNQEKIDDLNDTISEDDLVRIIIEKHEEKVKNERERLIKEGKIQSYKSPRYVFTRDTDAKNCIDAYINCSNQFFLGENKAKLHKYLNQFEYIDDMYMNRGEQTPYMFDKTDITDDLANECKRLIEENKEKAKEVYISENTGYYGSGATKNLYDHITAKEKLSLADAMMVMKYGDDEFQNKVIESIKQANVEDDRFKSFGVGEFCYKWMNPGQGNTCVFQDATLKAGFHGVPCCRGDQQEFIMSDDHKEITFQKVEYDPEKDIFYVDSTIKCIK